MESLGRYSFIVMTSVILSGVVNMRNEHVCIHSWGAVCSDSWVWGSGQRRRSDGQINGLGGNPRPSEASDQRVSELGL